MDIALPHVFPIFVSFFCMIMYAVYDLSLKAKILRAKLRKQGIDGPAPSLLLGNISDIQEIKSKASAEDTPTYNFLEPLSLDCCTILLPHLSQWTKQFGKTFSFAMGKVQILYIGDGELVKEMNSCKSPDLGKPSFLQKDRGPLLGKGLLTTSKEVWAHQRKTIAPTLYVNKVKDMLSIVLDSGNTLVESWEKMVETEGGIADIKVDEYVKNFTSSSFSNVMFGRYDVAHKGLFLKFRDLMEASGSPTVLDGRPFYRFFPTKRNREQWRLEKEIYWIILELAKESRMEEGESMIQTLVEGSKHGELGPSTPQQFIVDNCKELCIVAMDVPGITAIWGLMLLAMHPEWQSRARAEVLEVCGGQTPDAEKLGKMKILKMIIQEILRLYPGVGFTVREALADVQIGKKVFVPKGVNIWVWPAALHRDPQLWGPDALNFNPERFANGIPGACKIPQAYAPFGLGPRTCPGMNLGMMELKVMFSLILAKFSFSLSPNYRHVPKFDVLLQPKYGVNLIIHKL
ncbi:cytochrome P450 714C2-like [Apium graveolens]|uniref:cytochrome P450 714C2-like n=1 Tax=Apium graveolens TaxID=4045 RepID=UPI003D7BDBF6